MSGDRIEPPFKCYCAPTPLTGQAHSIACRVRNGALDRSPDPANDPPIISEHDALTAWIEHDQTHTPDDPPCDRCREFDALAEKAKRNG